MALKDEILQIEGVSEVSVMGGTPERYLIELDPVKLLGYHVSPFQILETVKSFNQRIPSTFLTRNNNLNDFEIGKLLSMPQELGNLPIQIQPNDILFLKDVAKIQYGPSWPNSSVWMTFPKQNAYPLYPAVTLSVTKKKGENAIIIVQKVLKKIQSLRGTLLPTPISVTVTRNYGKTAKEKADELLFHVFLATFSVVLLMAIALGLREAVVVLIAVPVTLSLTLFINYLFGYTLNRVTLFALIFSIGILVDDAIVVVENIHRHFKLNKHDPLVAVFAVDEVGNPTILATLTVIAALLPMAFVSGLMGPYMRPIPVGASSAMLFSLIVAFVVSPWLSYIVLKSMKSNHQKEENIENWYSRLYSKILSPFLRSRLPRILLFSAVFVVLMLSISLFVFKKVVAKMLPFDNKSELQIMVDLPTGSPVEKTFSVVQDLMASLSKIPEIKNEVAYLGTNGPIDFNGLVRHYDLRQAPWNADIQVNFVSKDKRTKQSHTLAMEIRNELDPVAAKDHARIKIVEMPPGPPVLSTLVAEIYGPSLKTRIQYAKEVKKIFETTPGVVDVDWYVDDPMKRVLVLPRENELTLSQVDAEQVNELLAMAYHGYSIGILHPHPFPHEPIQILFRLSLEKRNDLQEISEFGVPSNNGKAWVPLSDLVKLQEEREPQTIYHQDLKPVTYVIGDVAGGIESPIYAILNMKNKIMLPQYFTHFPTNDQHYFLKWGGEWTISFEVFRDLGIAFAVVLVLIYVLVVAWFKDYLIPLILMAPIPLTLIGIIPGHFLFHAFFTATSMIGFIALSGIIVRNSILLIDFVHLELNHCGELDEALIRAGSVRSRPILLTAFAVIIGSFVMILDPIFQGLAISMMFGAFVSTLLTLIIVPVLYYEFFCNQKRQISKEV